MITPVQSHDQTLKYIKYLTNCIFLCSLAIADLLFIIFCVPVTGADYILSSWPFGEVWCKIVQYLTYMTAYASVYTLLLLTLDRYLAVVHPIYAINSKYYNGFLNYLLITYL